MGDSEEERPVSQWQWRGEQTERWERQKRAAELTFSRQQCVFYTYSIINRGANVKCDNII